MYACVCHAVTEDAVRAHAEHGLRHVVAATRAGSGCGSCVTRLRGLCTDLGGARTPEVNAAPRELADSAA